jgi:hypothetical protein
VDEETVGPGRGCLWMVIAAILLAVLGGLIAYGIAFAHGLTTSVGDRRHVTLTETAVAR